MFRCFRRKTSTMTTGDIESGAGSAEEKTNDDRYATRTEFNKLREDVNNLMREWYHPYTIIQDKVCAICLDPLRPGFLVRTSCFHIYHDDCYLDMVPHQMPCPVCRGSLVTRDTCMRIRVLERPAADEA